MPYLGNTPSTSFATVVKDSFSGDGSTVAFTLSKVATTNSVSVFVENVRQEPTTAYAVSGTTLTFTAAPVTSSGNKIYVLYMNPTTTTTHPAAQNLTAVDGTFSGNIDVDGTANLDAVDIDGNVDITGTTALKDDVVFHGANYNVTWDKSDNALEFGDSAKLTFGAGNDLQIYHTAGTGSFIDEADDGSLFIRSSRITMHKYTGETMINAVADGAVSLYYNDVAVFTTTANGIQIQNATTTANIVIDAQASSSGTPQLQFNRGGTAYGLLEGGVNSAGNGFGSNLVIHGIQGDVYAKDSGGNSTQLSPHNFDYIPNGASETDAWCYKSDKFVSDIEKDEDGNKIGEKVKSATFISADITKVIRQVEKLTGEKLIYKGTLDVDEDGTVSKHIDDGSKVTENIIEALTKRIEALESK